MDNKSKAILAIFILGLVVSLYSGYRMNTCGYDCGLFSVSGQPVTVLAWVIGLGLLSLATLLTIIKLIKKYFHASR